jgi:hypothetical protein
MVGAVARRAWKVVVGLTTLRLGSSRLSTVPVARLCGHESGRKGDVEIFVYVQAISVRRRCWERHSTL